MTTPTGQSVTQGNPMGRWYEIIPPPNADSLLSWQLIGSWENILTLLILSVLVLFAARNPLLRGYLKLQLIKLMSWKMETDHIAKITQTTLIRALNSVTLRRCDAFDSEQQWQRFTEQLELARFGRARLQRREAVRLLSQGGLWLRRALKRQFLSSTSM